MEIDFDAHGFLLFLAHFAYVHFTLPWKALEGRCGVRVFGQNNFLKSIFFELNFCLIQNVANKLFVNLDGSEPVSLMLYGAKAKISQNRLSELRIPKVTG